MDAAVNYNNLIETLRVYSSQDEEQYDVVAILYLMRAGIKNLMHHQNQLDNDAIKTSFSPDQKEYLKNMIKSLKQ